MDPAVDAYLERADAWRAEMERLRRIALDAGLDEALKWGKPCFTVEGGNVAIIQPFKQRCAFMFFKGALLEDPDGLLERPGPHARAGRRMTFQGMDDVARGEDALRAFIKEAIEVERAGLQVEAAAPEPVPRELEEAFGEVPGLKAAFEALTPGRQRAYILHVSGAKQAATRRSRVERCVPRILQGKGWDR